jgi:hypothetical protein
MKSKSWIGLPMCAAAVTVVLSGLATSRAQQPSPEPSATSGSVNLQAAEGSVGNFEIRATATKKVSRASSLRRDIESVAAKLHSAPNDEIKAEGRKVLKKLLDEYFDEDMKERAAELDKVEDRVKKLRAQLGKRGDKKEEILDLQFKVLENEADGLGFFSNPAPQGTLRYGTEPMEDRSRMGREPANPYDPSNRPLKNPGQPRPNSNVPR